METNLAAAIVSAMEPHETDVTASALASRLEHTNLRADATSLDIHKLREEADHHGFRAVVVNPFWVPLASFEMKEFAPVSVVAVCGFPLGANQPSIKLAEAQRAWREGANGIDMVINISLAVAGKLEWMGREISELRAGLPKSVELKAIIEAPLLSAELIGEVAKQVVAAGADVVKTGTGTQGPVTVEQVRLIRTAVGPSVPIKAAGGIRTLEQCRALVEAGADYLGCSRSVEIIGAVKRESKGQPGN